MVRSVKWLSLAYLFVFQIACVQDRVNINEPITVAFSDSSTALTFPLISLGRVGEYSFKFRSTMAVSRPRLQLLLENPVPTHFNETNTVVTIRLYEHEEDLIYYYGAPINAISNLAGIDRGVGFGSESRAAQWLRLNECGVRQRYIISLEEGVSSWTSGKLTRQCLFIPGFGMARPDLKGDRSYRLKVTVSDVDKRFQDMKFRVRLDSARSGH